MAPCLLFSALTEKWLWWHEGGRGTLVRALHPSQSQPVPRKNSGERELRLVRGKPVASAAAWDGGDGWCWTRGLVLSSSTAFWPVPGQTLPIQCRCIVVIALFPCTLRQPSGARCAAEQLWVNGAAAARWLLHPLLSHVELWIFIFSQGWGFFGVLGFFSPF